MGLCGGSKLQTVPSLLLKYVAFYLFIFLGGYDIYFDLDYLILKYSVILFFYFLFFSFIFISWRLITLQYCSGFCHTLT